MAIVGPTGCGKSTLLNVDAGLLAPASGAVRIFGQPLGGLNAQAGYLFQADALFPWKTALDNVAIGLEIAGIAGDEALARAQEWLTSIGLGAFAALRGGDSGDSEDAGNGAHQAELSEPELQDASDLGRLLYACLTARWPGGPNAGLPAAP